MGRSVKRREKVTSDEEIKASTGKNWQEWFALLDEYGTEERGHELTVKYLRDHHKLAEPLAKEVALRYETDRGLRTLIS